MRVSSASSVPRLGSRYLFPDLGPRAYLAHAAVSPPSQPVVEAVRQHVQHMANLGVSGFGDVLAQREGVRARLARLIDALPDEVALLQNTSVSLAAVASGLRLGPGDRVVLFAGEYPSNVHPFVESSKRAGAEVDFFDASAFQVGPDAACQALEVELSRGARLLSVSAVEFQTGFRMPLERIGSLCRSHRVLFCVDAVQALGAVPLSVQQCQIDFLACGAHKWLMGLDGVAALYVRPEALSELAPLLVGSMSYQEAMRMLLGEPGQLRYDRPMLGSARLFEGGMASSTSIAALDAALELIEALGVSSIFEHIQCYHDALEPQLVGLGFSSVRSEQRSNRSGTLSLRPPGGISAAALVEKLASHGVVASCPDGLLRLAPHWPNPIDEASEVAAAVARSCRELRR